MPRQRFVWMVWSLAFSLVPQAVLAEGPGEAWVASGTIQAPEAFQAAAADETFAYAITNSLVAKYDRTTRKRVAVSTGEAKHLNSGFLRKGRVYCAHSNYPETPERSEIKVLDTEAMRLATFHDFGDFGGSLTWCLRENDHHSPSGADVGRISFLPGRTHGVNGERPPVEDSHSLTLRMPHGRESDV